MERRRDYRPGETELSNRAKAALPPGRNRVHIYDTPLQVLAPGAVAIAEPDE